MSTVPGGGPRRVVAMALSLVFVLVHLASAAHLLSCSHVVDPGTGVVLDVCDCVKDVAQRGPGRGPSMDAGSESASTPGHACAFAWGLPCAVPSMDSPDAAVADVAVDAPLPAVADTGATAIPIYLLAPGHSPPASA